LRHLKRILIHGMIRILATIFSGLFGLAFGSFLNLCLSRWPAGESIVTPRSHCRQCNRTLSWWENLPLASWLALRGRCRGCRAWIGWRYPLVELAVGALWAMECWRTFASASFPGSITFHISFAAAGAVANMILDWILVALAVLDAEQLWLPDWITLPGIALGFLFRVFLVVLSGLPSSLARTLPLAAGRRLLAIVLAAGLILLTRWVYWLIRRREGIGLGDAKLMALLAAWLGFWGALLSFCMGVILGAAIALILLATPKVRTQTEAWGLLKLPLGTFLCVGGILSSLWGSQIIAAYLRVVGF
jgi:leader peptidase (prepilin peptidase) / N-methyltransferase